MAVSRQAVSNRGRILRIMDMETPPKIVLIRKNTGKFFIIVTYMSRRDKKKIAKGVKRAVAKGVKRAPRKRF